MKGQLILIDGISNSGKTTLCNYLQSSNSVLVDEVPLYIKNHSERYGISSLPPMPKTIEEEKDNQDLLLTAEIDRLEDAQDILNTGKNAVLDRSFLSTVAMAYAFDKRNTFEGSYENAKLLLQKYLEEINSRFNKDDILFVFLDVANEKIRNRNQNRVMPLSLEWIDKSFLDLQRSFFEALSTEFASKIVDTTNLTTEQIFGLMKMKMGGIRL